MLTEPLQAFPGLSNDMPFIGIHVRLGPSWGSFVDPPRESISSMKNFLSCAKRLYGIQRQIQNESEQNSTEAMYPFVVVADSEGMSAPRRGLSARPPNHQSINQSL